MIRLENNNTELHYDKYVKRGSLMQLRAGLGLNDPDHQYNYLKNSSVLQEAGVTPEDFGIFHPVAAKYMDKTKEELIADMTELILENDKLYLNSMYLEGHL